ncbi:homocysteine S-methyltransferase family protein, partial [Eggerthella sinensis]|uniref:homocysteine S-methyltransferase family protein n=1 Tax=Eggerthella sinensis TaxID=242230 RepID=UPI003A4E3CF2
MRLTSPLAPMWPPRTPSARDDAPFELLNLTHPAAVTAIHAAYVAAGADVATTN